MPELPEVEAARSLVHSAFAGSVITSVVAVEGGGGPRDALFDEIVCSGISSADELSTALVGKRLVRCCRKGKQMWWQLSKCSGSGSSGSAASAGDAASASADLHPTWHFGMTGAFTVRSAAGEAAGSKYKRFSVDASSWPPRFTKVRVAFDNGAELAFTDPRRLARVRLVRNPETEPPVSELGPDALLELPALPAFEASLAGRATSIKALLLDQSFLAGIGNWVADEVLYQARIHPETAAHALDRAAVAALHAAICSVLEHAVSVGADSAKFPPNWLFHARWGKGKGAAKTADGKAITFVTVGGRTSAVVPSVQGAPKSKPADHVAAVLAARSAAARATAGATLAAAAAGGASVGADASAAVKAKSKSKAPATKAIADATEAGPTDSPAPLISPSSSATDAAAAGTGSGSSDDAGAVEPVVKAKPSGRQRKAIAPRVAAASEATAASSSAASLGAGAEPPSLTGFKRSRTNDAIGSTTTRDAVASPAAVSAASALPVAAAATVSEGKAKGAAGSAAAGAITGSVAGSGAGATGPAAKRARAAKAKASAK